MAIFCVGQIKARLTFLASLCSKSNKQFFVYFSAPFFLLSKHNDFVFVNILSRINVNIMVFCLVSGGNKSWREILPVTTKHNAMCNNCFDSSIE